MILWKSGLPASYTALNGVTNYFDLHLVIMTYQC